MLAACWFSLCGFATAIPVEPVVYDLLVSMQEGIKRVQVKTTTYYSKGGWQVAVGRRPYSAGNRKGLVPYDPELIDLFFIVDGDLAMYLIPSQVIAGRVQILLRTYVRYIVGNALGLMTPTAALEGRSATGSTATDAPWVIRAPPAPKRAPRYGAGASWC